jgi:hypothetical protein
MTNPLNIEPYTVSPDVEALSRSHFCLHSHIRIHTYIYVGWVRTR